jgi:hypothetical protein
VYFRIPDDGQSPKAQLIFYYEEGTVMKCDYGEESGSEYITVPTKSA